jgi:hypothetical protein
MEITMIHIPITGSNSLGSRNITRRRTMVTQIIEMIAIRRSISIRKVSKLLSPMLNHAEETNYVLP